MSETVSGKPKDDGPQALGSVITYLRRYALAAFAGVAPEDDDAEAAMGREKPAAIKAVKPGGYDNWLFDLAATAHEGTAALESAWKQSRADYRTHLTTTDNAKWDAIKSHAKKLQAVSA